MAKVAGHGHVRSGQREGRIVVIKICTCPVDCGVTDGAIFWEPRSNMIWHRDSERRGAQPGRYMAPIAGY